MSRGLELSPQHVGLPTLSLCLITESSYRLENTKREDVVFIAFQLWVLGMSIVAVSRIQPPALRYLTSLKLLNESIPHMCVVFMISSYIV